MYLQTAYCPVCLSSNVTVVNKAAGDSSGKVIVCKDCSEASSIIQETNNPEGNWLVVNKLEP
ncbi:hypothetical protein [Serratia fonticola]